MSGTLDAEPGWNSEVIPGDPVAYVEELRATDGGDILVGGPGSDYLDGGYEFHDDRIKFGDEPAGIQVDLYDGMPSVGRKFLLAGVGGMNITHSEDFTPFLSRYGERYLLFGTLASAVMQDFAALALHALWCRTAARPSNTSVSEPNWLNELLNDSRSPP